MEGCLVRRRDQGVDRWKRYVRRTAGTIVSLIFAFNAICIQFTMLGIAGAALGPEASTRSMSLRSSFSKCATRRLIYRRFLQI